MKHYTKEMAAIYDSIIDKLTNQDIYNNFMFVPHKGQHYTPDQDFLFYGRAAREFGPGCDEILEVGASNVPEEWTNGSALTALLDNWGCQEGYNPGTSAFWRVIRGVVSHYHDDWKNHLAYSNLYKIAGVHNPSDALCSRQFESCQRLFWLEHKILNPKATIILSGWNWACDFLSDAQLLKTYKWSSVYELKVIKLNGRLFIVTEHPQTKPENIHLQTITHALQAHFDLPF